MRSYVAAMVMIWRGLTRAMNVPPLLISSEPLAIEHHERDDIPFLQKPFPIAELEQKIKQLIGKRPNGSARRRLQWSFFDDACVLQLSMRSSCAFGVV
jgi:hypothetical protein